MDITSKTLKIGENVKLVATVETSDETTDKTVNWSSSNSTVASVDNDGTVTAKTAGTATITAASKTDSGKKATLSDYCNRRSIKSGRDLFSRN